MRASKAVILDDDYDDDEEEEEEKKEEKGLANPLLLLPPRIRPHLRRTGAT